jgi:hypothetical protein
MRKLLKKLICMAILKKLVPANKKIEQGVENDLSKFGSSPTNLTIQLPSTICDPERVFLRGDVWLGPGSPLFPLSGYPGTPSWSPKRSRSFHQEFDPKIVINDQAASTTSLMLTVRRQERHQQVGWGNAKMNLSGRKILQQDSFLSDRFDLRIALATGERALLL